MNAFVVVSCPEKWNLTIRNVLVQHIKCCVSTLIQRSNPVFCSHSTTSGPIRIACDITCCINIFCRCLKEWITNDTTVLIKLYSRVFQETCCWLNTCANYNKVSLYNTTIWKNNWSCITIRVYTNFCCFYVLMKLNSVLLMFLRYKFTNFLS